MTENKRYKAEVRLKASECEKIRKLLDIDSIDGMSDEELDAVGASRHDRLPVYTAKFEDGSVLSYELCSGSTNYWGDITWTAPGSGMTADCEPDYDFGSMELEIEGVTYEVCIIEETELEQYVTRMLTLSTGHIDGRTAKLLDADSKDGNKQKNLPSVSVYKKGGRYPVGWFVYLPDDEPAGHEHSEYGSVPACLTACFDVCRENRCSILCLDRDGPVVEDLPTYNDW